MVLNTANLSSKIKIELTIRFNYMKNFGRVTIHPNVSVALPVCTCCPGLINNNIPSFLSIIVLKINDMIILVISDFDKGNFSAIL